MPTYDYKCSSCLFQGEIEQKITEKHLTSCPKCHQETFKRGFGGGAAVTFQGSFYATNFGEKQSATSQEACCPCGKQANSCAN